MMTGIEQLLCELESTSADIHRCLQPATSNELDPVADLDDSLDRRAALIQQLGEALKLHNPLSYQNFNRLVAQQAQGNQLMLLLGDRRGLLLERAQELQRHRMYAVRLQTELQPPKSDNSQLA